MLQNRKPNKKPVIDKPLLVHGAHPTLADQILLPQNFPSSWIKSIKDGKTGKVYTYEEFKRKFPEQIKK